MEGKGPSLLECGVKPAALQIIARGFGGNPLSLLSFRGSNFRLVWERFGSTPTPTSHLGHQSGHDQNQQPHAQHGLHGISWSDRGDASIGAGGTIADK
jgi:hypothetical protein